MSQYIEIAEFVYRFKYIFIIYTCCLFRSHIFVKRFPDILVVYTVKRADDKIIGVFYCLCAFLNCPISCLQTYFYTFEHFKVFGIVKLLNKVLFSVVVFKIKIKCKLLICGIVRVIVVGYGIHSDSHILSCLHHFFHRYTAVVRKRRMCMIIVHNTVAPLFFH